MIQKPKGTYDVFGEYGKKILYLEDLLQVLMEKYNYEFVRTPIFESSELFHRGVGETSDIVTKETYDFIDRGERNVTLRPEGTAGVVRSFIENKMYGRASQPVKTWYYGPMYRYERPQSGRFREFYQFGVEVFGTENPLMDAEVISIPVRFYQLLGLKNIKVNINSLGDSESRENYRKALIEYFEPHINELCEDCKNRFEKNPLRILDCKIDAKNPIMENAPKMIDYLNETSREHFNKVQEYLKAMNIDFVVNPKIVRGLDYYTHTVFEVEASVEGFGSQNVLGAGGRYNNLVSSIGGPATPGVGFALGLERLITALDFEKINIVEENNLDIYIIPMSINETNYSINLLDTLRMNGFNCDMDYLNRNLKSNFKQSERLGAKYIIIIGEEEINTDVLTIKNNITKEEQKIHKEDLIEFFDKNISHE
ncbi:MAG: histidine--tRNA ligase [Firmicutes bacterium]|nr:histidine--tRNA ligase [Bacillota bacterium]